MIVLLLCLAILMTACTPVQNISEAALQQGQTLAYARNKGNCLACHVIAEGDFPGTIGPKLSNLSNRFDDKQQLKTFIWDATQFNPQTVMPPFGKNGIINEQEINKIVDYLWTLK